MPLHPIQIKARIVDYLHHLTDYDYIAYGWLLGVLVAFLLLSVLLSSRFPKTALLMVAIVLAGMITGPFAMKYLLDQTVRKVVLTDTHTTQLPFSKNLIVIGTIENQGRIDMSGCRIFVDILRKDTNRYKQFFYSLRPLRKEMLMIKKKVHKGDKMPYKVVFDHFAMKEGYQVKQSVECF
ncbi:MAG: hypothetical protein DSZ05_05855 [Sulfurospirillum sp.]|nr:MAG: hypothetical protein DSZ05_05855 [Sulfurospirillum sp.]